MTFITNWNYYHPIIYIYNIYYQINSCHWRSNSRPLPKWMEWMPSSLAPATWVPPWVAERCLTKCRFYGWFGYGSIPINTILMGWTSIYQLFWCEQKGYKVLTHCHLWMMFWFFLGWFHRWVGKILWVISRMIGCWLYTPDGFQSFLIFRHLRLHWAAPTPRGQLSSPGDPWWHHDCGAGARWRRPSRRPLRGLWPLGRPVAVRLDEQNGINSPLICDIMWL